MRSRRSWLETACRVGAFALIGWLLGDSLIPISTRRVERASNAAVAQRLPRWTRLPSAVTLHVTFDTAPAPEIADWLNALRHAGHAVHWTGFPPAALISASTIPDPAGGVRIEVAGPDSAQVSLEDDAGAVAQTRIASLGASVVAPAVVGSLRARVGSQALVASVPDSAALRSVMVVGQAGWEGKFVVSALEERGWRVVTRFSVAPSVDVEQGISTLDTARIGAVIMLDSSADDRARDVERFARSGGGVILAGSAGASSAWARLAAGVTGPRTHPDVASVDTVGLGTTGFYPVASLGPDGVVLERRAGHIAVAARRVGAGRVLQLGYDDSWRWRMAGAAGSVEAHRAWWSRAVASVVYVPPVVRARPSAELAAFAPLARLASRLGPPQPAADSGPSGRIDPRIILTAIMILLLTEWCSRRLRGLR